jgi:hypothetical protein
MSPEIRREALMAAARIACAVALVGCGPKSGAAVTPPTDGTPAVAQPAPAADPGSCEDTVAAAFAQPETPADDDDAGWEAHWAAQRAALAEARDNAEVVACCEQEIESKLDDPSGAWDWEHLRACCDVTGMENVACTPWGPPTPPAMRGEA